MSLEGLDSAALTDAFETASGEPGGWFWIKYISRDEVELLASGTNGTEGMRLAAYTQPDDSPLYGFIKFRRRAVLVKYVPDGTSRVVKARSQVHFALVEERFSPHDTTHTISTPKELTDTGLNSSCSTHTASASISSSNSSLRQRRLADIAESADEEDDGPAKSSLSVTSHPRDFLGPDGGADAGAGGDEGGQGGASDRDSAGSGHANGPDAFLPGDKGDASSTTPSTRLDPPDSAPRRKSSSSSPRPDLDIYNHYPYVPKVKLGPRPHVADSNNQHQRRPHSSERSKAHPPSSSSSAAGAEEPRASIPKSVHLPSRKNALPPRSTSLAATLELPQPPPTPKTPSTPSSVVSLPNFSTSPSSIASGHSDSGAIPPEKARLMKALQLRRQNLAMAQEQKEQDTVVDTVSVTPDEKTPTQADMPLDVNDKEAATGAGGETTGEDRGSSVEQQEQGDSSVPAAENSEERDRRDTIKAPVQTYISSNDDTAVQRKETSHDDESIADESEPTPEDVSEPIVQAAAVPTPSISVKEFEEAAEKKALDAKTATDQRPSTATTVISVTDTDADKTEGTKVRDDILDSESDAESARSMEVGTTESRPVTMIRSDASSMPPPPVPTSQTPHDSATDSNSIPTPQSPDASATPLKSLKRIERSISQSDSTEHPPVETPRSVSAPFIKPARVQQNDPKTGASKKVNVGMGSVSQRIKQFQQLATAPKKSYTPPPRTPSRSNSPTPEWANRVSMLKTSPPGPPAAPILRKSSFHSVGPALQRAPGSSSSQTGPLNQEQSAYAEFIEKDNQVQLQVTTKIQRAEAQPLSPTSILGLTCSPTESTEGFATSSLRRKSVDLNSVVDQMSLRRSSIDHSNLARSLSTSTDKGDKPRLFSRSSSRDKDVNGAAAELSDAKDGAGRAKRSPSFLKRVGSSLSRKKDGAGAEPTAIKQDTASSQPSSSASAAAEEPRKKKWLLSGWLNVQMPDTMLWRQRYIKVEDAGYMYLGLSEDEANPPARRFHLPTEVRKIETPDVDEQELPFSVRLLLNEGGMIQCACMNSKEQKEVLAVLRKGAAAV